MRRYQYAAIIGLAQDDTDAVLLTADDKSWVQAAHTDMANLNQITDLKYKKFIVSNM